MRIALWKGRPPPRAKFVCHAMVCERHSSAARRKQFLEARNSSATWADRHTDLRRSLEELACAHGRQSHGGNRLQEIPPPYVPQVVTFYKSARGQHGCVFTQNLCFHRQDGGGFPHLMSFRFNKIFLKRQAANPNINSSAGAKRRSRAGEPCDVLGVSGGRDIAPSIPLPHHTYTQILPGIGKQYACDCSKRKTFCPWVALCRHKGTLCF